MTDDDEPGDVPMEGMGMIRELPEIGRPGPPIDILFGGDVDPATGRLLSIAQLQAQLRARAGRPPGPPAAQPQLSQAPPVQASQAAASVPERAHPEERVDDAQLAGPLRWIAVVGAQPGAGCTVTALAMADGAAQLGRPVHLVAGGGYALTGVADRELGVVDGGWQRGRRGDVVLDHTAGYPVSAWPPIPSRPDAPVTTILDAGASWAGGWWWPVPRPPVAVIIACRASVPGVICAERVLGDLSSKPGLLSTRKPGGNARHAPGGNARHAPGGNALHAPGGNALVGQPDSTQVVIAAVGKARWHSSVQAACGPLLSQLMDRGHVIAVPHLRRMEVSGPSADALPRQLIAAGRAIWTVAAGHHNDNNNDSNHSGGQ